MEHETGNATALAVIDGQEFAILKADPQRITKIIKENCGDDAISALDLDRIKIPSGGMQAWSIPGLDGEEVCKEFVGVALFHKGARVFWKDAYVGQGNPPDCSSSDGVAGVGEPGGDCGLCPFARFGSDIKGGKGGKGQACKQIKQVFVIRPGNIIPVLLSLPPTSLQPAKQYFLRLANVGKHYTAVLTRFSLEKDKNDQGIEYSKVVLSKVADLTEEQAAAFRSMCEAMKPWLAKVRASAEDYQTAIPEDEEAPVGTAEQLDGE